MLYDDGCIIIVVVIATNIAPSTRYRRRDHYCNDIIGCRWIWYGCSTAAVDGVGEDVVGLSTVYVV